MKSKQEEIKQFESFLGKVEKNGYLDMIFKGTMSYVIYQIKNDFGVPILDRIKEERETIGKLEAEISKLKDALKFGRRNQGLMINKIGTTAGKKLRDLNFKRNHYITTCNTLIECKNDLASELQDVRLDLNEKEKGLEKAKQENLELKARLYDLEHKGE